MMMRKRQVMAKQSYGILDGYRGSIGPVIGYQWRGKWCLRARPRRVRNPRSEAQQEHRMVFRDMVRLASHMLPALRMGLYEAAVEEHMTEGNLFVKMNKELFAPRGVDYEALAVSAGPVAPVAFVGAAVDDRGVFCGEFEKNPLGLRASGDDQVYVYAYCPSERRGVLSAGVARRRRRVAMALPDGWADLEVHFYAFVRDDRNRASETAHIVLDEGDEATAAEPPVSVGAMAAATAGAAAERPTSRGHSTAPTAAEPAPPGERDTGTP